MARRLTISWLLAALALLPAARAEAQELSAALSLERRGLLEEALEAFEAALSRRGNTTEDLATIYLHLAMLRFGAGDPQRARQALLRLLCVDPGAELPESAPPELGELLDEAARAWSGRRLDAEVEGPEEGGGRLRLSVRVVDDLAGLVAVAALSAGGVELSRAEGQEGRFELLVDRDEAAEGLDLQLLDEHGGLLWQREVLEPGQGPPEFGAGAEGGRRRPEGRAPLSTAGWVVLGAGLLSTAVGALLVAMDGSETGEQRLGEGYIDVEVLDTDGGGWALIGLGAAAIVTGAALLLVQRLRRSWYTGESGADGR